MRTILIATRRFKALFGSTTDEDKVKASIDQVEKALAG